MSVLTLFVLRLVFLGLLWAFVFSIVYALRTDLFGQRVRKLPADAAAPAYATPAAAAAPIIASPAPAAASGSSSATRLVITAGAKEGLEVPLPGELLTIGRSSESGLVIRDDYTSTHHARLLKRPDGWLLEDLDSTNGSFLAGTRVIIPTQVPLNTPVTIGTTSFELRR